METIIDYTFKTGATLVLLGIFLGILYFPLSAKRVMQFWGKRGALIVPFLLTTGSILFLFSWVFWLIGRIWGAW